MGINPLNAELNPICHLLALLEAHHILHLSRVRVKPARDKVKFHNGAMKVSGLPFHTRTASTAE